MEISELEYLVLIIILSIINLYLIWKLIILKLSHNAEIKKARNETAKRQRATIKGDISEIIAPWTMDCVNSVKELRFLGSPIDFVGFRGLDGDGDIDIKLVEIKSGKSRLSKNQRRIRDAVESNRIEWVEVRVTEINQH